MTLTDIERIRSFNRAVTVRAGALDESYLGRGRPLGQARVLFETGPEGIDLAVLRQRLGLDSGYAARMLRILSRRGLIAVETDPDDRRRRKVRLTETGMAEWRAYDAMSADVAEAILRPLGDAQRQRLVAAMAEVETLLMASSILMEPEPHDSKDANACLDAYFAELGSRFESGFDAVKIGGKPVAPLCFLLARLDGDPVGCGVLSRLDERTGEIKRMWVAPRVRGLGVSRRMLSALEERARAAGLDRIRLDTNKALTEAQTLYRKTGYREIERYNDNPYAQVWFEKELG